MDAVICDGNYLSSPTLIEMQPIIIVDILRLVSPLSTFKKPPATRRTSVTAKVC